MLSLDVGEIVSLAQCLYFSVAASEAFCGTGLRGGPRPRETRRLLRCVRVLATSGRCAKPAASEAGSLGVFAASTETDARAEESCPRGTPRSSTSAHRQKAAPCVGGRESGRRAALLRRSASPSARSREQRQREGADAAKTPPFEVECLAFAEAAPLPAESVLVQFQPRPPGPQAARGCATRALLSSEVKGLSRQRALLQTKPPSPGEG